MQLTADPRVQKQLTKTLKMCKDAGMSQEEAVEYTARMFSSDASGQKFDLVKVLNAHAADEEAKRLADEKKRAPKDIWDML